MVAWDWEHDFFRAREWFHDIRGTTLRQTAVLGAPELLQTNTKQSHLIMTPARVVWVVRAAVDATIPPPAGTTVVLGVWFSIIPKHKRIILRFEKAPSGTTVDYL